MNKIQLNLNKVVDTYFSTDHQKKFGDEVKKTRLSSFLGNLKVIAKNIFFL